MRCENIIRCWDFTNRQCLCQEGHIGGCNPFSPTPMTDHLRNTRSEKQPINTIVSSDEVLYNPLTVEEVLTKISTSQ